MARADEPVFLERQSYRRRRLSDAAKLLPVVGLVLMLLPLLWSGAGETAGGVVYIFTVWAIMIFVARVLSHRLGENEPEERQPGNQIG